jgi:hypothetical protein
MEVRDLKNRRKTNISRMFVKEKKNTKKKYKEFRRFTFKFFCPGAGGQPVKVFLDGSNFSHNENFHSSLYNKNVLFSALINERQKILKYSFFY